MRFMPERSRAYDLFDDMFAAPVFTNSALMRTDIHEKDGKYLIDMDLPGFKKEDIQISLYNGNLTVTASRNETNEEKDDKGTLIRQERSSGSCSRSFYVGTGVKEGDIRASFENGTLKLEVPTEKEAEKEETKYIDIF